jgi:hypothetical protein
MQFRTELEKSWEGVSGCASGCALLLLPEPSSFLSPPLPPQNTLLSINSVTFKLMMRFSSSALPVPNVNTKKALDVDRFHHQLQQNTAG